MKALGLTGFVRFFKKKNWAVPVLTYHSLNVTENTYSGNDHVAFESDLRTIDRLGLKIIPLSMLVDGLKRRIPPGDLKKCVAITIDDGSWLDYHDIEHPTCGLQRGFFNILKDFQTSDAGARQKSLHMTSFVIVSPRARLELDRKCLIGKGWWGDDWWPEADSSGLMAVECHSWDHVHDALDQVSQKDNVKGDFRQVNSYQDCSAQVTGAAEYLEQVISRRPSFFAYPWGEASSYMIEEFMPVHQGRHRFEAAFSIDARPVTPQENIWNLPRFVCGRDWKSPDELAAVLEQSS